MTDDIVTENKLVEIKTRHDEFFEMFGHLQQIGNTANIHYKSPSGKSLLMVTLIYWPEDGKWRPDGIGQSYSWQRDYRTMFGKGGL